MSADPVREVRTTPALRFARFDPRDAERDAALRALDEGDVEVWAFDLSGTPEDVERWSRLLSPDERDRGGRFLRSTDRDAYIVAHGTTRSLLAAYCGVPPAALVLGRAAHGKPRLQPPQGDIRFNLAHSHGCGVLAVSRGREVGIDLEREREDVEALSLAERFFFGAEHAAIAAAAPQERTRTFFRYWVAKESVLKAQGVGLTFPLDGFSIEFAADGDSATVRSCAGSGLSDGWHVRPLTVPSGWHAALATPGDCRVRWPGAPG